MNDKCKCKNANEFIAIEKVGIRCQKCNKWVVKFRNEFYKATRVKPDIKKYDRKKFKQETKKIIKEEL